MKKKMKIIFMTVISSILLTGCALPGLSGAPENTIRIGTLGTSESNIMGNILSIMIERETDLDTTLISNLGSSIVQHQAMLKDEIDISATRYTGTDISGALGMDPITDPDLAMATVKEEFQERFDQTWADSYGFENSYSLAVREDFAEANNIETISDLEPYAQDMRFGVDNAWVNRDGDGYDGFQETYYSFGEVFPMNIGLVYEALGTGSMDAVLAYSSDGRIQAYDLKVLEDDKRFFPPYDTSPVINNDVLRANPEIGEIFDKLAGTISTEKMQELNYKADVLLQSPRQVAIDFLKEHNYFEKTSEEANA